MHCPVKRIIDLQFSPPLSFLPSTTGLLRTYCMSSRANRHFVQRRDAARREWISLVHGTESNVFYFFHWHYDGWIVLRVLVRKSTTFKCRILSLKSNVGVSQFIIFLDALPGKKSRLSNTFVLCYPVLCQRNRRWIPKKIHFMEWDELGSLRRRGISPQLTATAP